MDVITNTAFPLVNDAVGSIVFEYLTGRSSRDIHQDFGFFASSSKVLMPDAKQLVENASQATSMFTEKDEASSNQLVALSINK